MPRAKGPGFGRVVGGLDGDGGTASDWREDVENPRDRSGGAFCPLGNKLMGRLHGVSGMFLLKPNMFWGSSALRFFLEIKPVDMNAAGRGFTSL